MPTPDIIEPLFTGAARRRAGLRARLLWFAGLWAMSVAAIALVAYAIRWLLGM